MEKIRLTWLLVWAVCSTALATGPMYDDTPPALPFYLHRLPAKSLEDIYAETQPPIAPATPHRWAPRLSQPIKLGVRTLKSATGNGVWSRVPRPHQTYKKFNIAASCLVVPACALVISGGVARRIG